MVNGKCLEPQGTSFSHHRVECHLHKTAEAVDVGRALECKILSEKLKSEARAVENYCVTWERVERAHVRPGEEPE